MYIEWLSLWSVYDNYKTRDHIKLLESIDKNKNTFLNQGSPTIFDGGTEYFWTDILRAGHFCLTLLFDLFSNTVTGLIG